MFGGKAGQNSLYNKIGWLIIMHLSLLKKWQVFFNFLKMRLRTIIFSIVIFSIVFVLGCLEESKKEAINNKELKANTEQPSGNTTLTKGELISQLNCLEKLFNNDNFYFINKKDTQYLYVTRLNQENIFTHYYKMFHGDSTQLKVDTIQQIDEKVVWNWNKQPLFLDSVSNQFSRWVNAKNGTTIEFNKNINGELFYTNEQSEKFKLTKTPQISLFLSRSFYDFKNGTHFAFDTSNFTKKH
jgi:hypothetical protein